MKKHWSVGLGILLSGILLVLAFRQVPPEQIWRSFRSVRLGYLPALLMLGFLDLVIRAWRWKLLLSQAAPASVWDLLRLESIGLALNNVLFLRLGELARGALASRQLGIPIATALSTILVERVMDLTALLFLFVAAVVWLPGVAPFFTGQAALVAGLGALGFLMGFPWLEPLLRGRPAWEKIVFKYPRLERLVGQLALGTKPMKSASTFLKILGWSFCLWLADAALFYGVALAMDFKPSLSYAHSIVVLATTGVACLLPAVPGYFGAFEQAVKTLLVSWGASPSAALGYAGFTHILTYSFITLLGMFFLYQMGHSLSSLRRILKDET